MSVPSGGGAFGSRLGRFHTFCHKAVFGRSVKWFALFADCLTLASVPLALFHEAHLGCAMKRVAVPAHRLAFTRLSQSGLMTKATNITARIMRFICSLLSKSIDN